MTNTENFVSLLYYFGLLTIRGINDENTPILAIPNETIKRLYYDYIHNAYKETGVLNLKIDHYNALMKGMAYKGNWQDLITFIATCMNASLSLRDLMKGEKAHQVFWNVYLGLNTLFSVYSEKEMNHGFADLVLEPILVNNPGINFAYIIEIKYIKPADVEKENGSDKIEALRCEAESQLNQYSLDEKFRKTIASTTLKKVILIFSGNQLVHSSEI